MTLQLHRFFSSLGSIHRHLRRQSPACTSISWHGLHSRTQPPSPDRLFQGAVESLPGNGSDRNGSCVDLFLPTSCSWTRQGKLYSIDPQPTPSRTCPLLSPSNPSTPSSASHEHGHGIVQSFSSETVSGIKAPFDLSARHRRARTAQTNSIRIVNSSFRATTRCSTGSISPVSQHPVIRMMFYPFDPAPAHLRIDRPSQDVGPVCIWK